MSKEESSRVIEDIYIAAGLLAYKAELVDIDKTDPRHQKFKFLNSVPKIFVLSDDSNVEIREGVTVDTFESLYLSSKLLFPASYPDSIRRIKSIIFS